MGIELSEKQRQTVAAAITILAAFVIVCAIAAIVWLLARFFMRFSGVFLPLAVAAVLAFVFRPYYELFHERLRLPAAVSLILVLVSVLLPLVGFGWFFGHIVVGQVTEMVEDAPQTWARAQAWVEERLPRVVQFFEESAIGQRIRDAVEGQEATLVQGLQTGLDAALAGAARVLQGVVTIVAWAVLPVYFAFFLMAEPGKLTNIDHLLPFLKKETRDNVVYLFNEFIDILVAFFRGQLIIAFLQGLLFAVGFQVVGLRYGLVLGLSLGFLNIIPYLGNMVGLGIALPLAFFQQGGGGMLVVWVLVVFALVQVIEGYVLTPKIMGDRTGLHPMAIIIAIFFWGSALSGLSGMILAIPLTAFLVVFWRLAKERYIGELV